MEGLQFTMGKDILVENVTFKQSHGGGKRVSHVDMGWQRESIPGQAEKCMALEVGYAWSVRVPRAESG